MATKFLHTTTLEPQPTSGELFEAHAWWGQRLLHAMYVIAVIILWSLVEQSSRVVSLVGSDKQILTYMCVCVTVSSWIISIDLQSILSIDRQVNINPVIKYNRLKLMGSDSIISLRALPRPKTIEMLHQPTLNTLKTQPIPHCTI